MEQFKAALAPLIDAKKFACVLAQFPHSFHANPANRDYIKRVREGFGDLPVVVGFRSREWTDERTLSFRFRWTVYPPAGLIRKTSPVFLDIYVS
jgi:uncharacterized protein YecE (DUF72 family)